MRTLYLTRHAKSSWDDPSSDDFHRPLNARGLRDAPFMAALFARRGERVDRLVTSPAVRALTTAQAFAKALDRPLDQLVQDRSIYLASAEALLGIVNRLPDQAQRVMLFGHNPGFSELVEYLSDGDIGDMPTCCIARIDFTAGTWGEIGAGTGTLAWYDYPKRHPELT